MHEPVPRRIATPHASVQGPLAVAEHFVSFPALDDFRLGGILFSVDAAQRSEVVVFNPGAGLRVLRYKRFLRYLASEGFTVVGYDYRGIGGSADAKRRFVAGFEDWAELDHGGALRYARDLFPHARVSSISHSIGCMVAAASQSSAIVEQMVFIAPHTGYWGDYQWPWRWPMAFLWHVLMPGITQIVGHFPGQLLRLGDGIPRRIALQWAARTKPDFRFGAYGGDTQREFKAALRMSHLQGRALVISAPDDAFASEPAIRRFLFGVPNLAIVRREFGGSIGARRVGHWGYFRETREDCWRVISQFLKTHVPKFTLASEWQ